MELEGQLEFSLGCLKHLGVRKTEQLTFPLILQVCDISECVSRPKTEKNNGKYNQSFVLSVSDGFYRTNHTFLVLNKVTLHIFSVISITNIDFEYQIEGSFNSFAVAGVILDYSVIKSGDEIGFLLGRPTLVELRTDHSRGQRVQPTERMVDNLSHQLWKQVKEERCCDVRFIFPHLPGTPSIMAQRSALIANSPVFEVQFEGNFADVSGDIPITDTEPAYLRCIFQFIFTKFVPILSLTQAFEILYLAKKYLLEDLVDYCKDFIMNNEQKVYGVPDIFTYFEMNQKCLDDDIAKFSWDKLQKYANNYIRQQRFQELDFNTLESFLLLKEANCHEWELVQALRRWAVANNASARCHTDESNTCLHQLLECIRWETMPVKEAIMAKNWSEFGLQNDENEKDFLADILEMQRSRKGRSISHNDVVPITLNQQYSHNRKYFRDDSFVIYTNLYVDPPLLNVSCLHGISASAHTKSQTHCPTIGPPFELKGFFVVPSYNLSSETPQSKVKLTVHLTCQGKTFSAEPDNMWTCSEMILTVFSFSPSRAAKKSKKAVNFWPDRDSSMQDTITFSRSELEFYVHQTDEGDVMDVQMRFVTNTDTDRIVNSPPKIMHSRLMSPQPSTSNATDQRGELQPSSPRTHHSQAQRENAWAGSLGRTVSIIRRGRWDQGSESEDDRIWSPDRRRPSPSFRSRSPSRDLVRHRYESNVMSRSPPRHRRLSPPPSLSHWHSRLQPSGARPWSPIDRNWYYATPDFFNSYHNRRQSNYPRRGRRESPDLVNLSSSSSVSPRRGQAELQSPGRTPSISPPPPPRRDSPVGAPSPRRSPSLRQSPSPVWSPQNSRSPSPVSPPRYSPNRKSPSYSPPASVKDRWLAGNAGECSSESEEECKRKTKETRKLLLKKEMELAKMKRKLLQMQRTESRAQATNNATMNERDDMVVNSEDSRVPLSPDPQPGPSGSSRNDHNSRHVTRDVVTSRDNSRDSLQNLPLSRDSLQNLPSSRDLSRDSLQNLPSSPKYSLQYDSDEASDLVQVAMTPPLIDVDIEPSEEPARPIGEDEDEQIEAIHYPGSEDNELLIEEEVDIETVDITDIEDTEPQT